jgi:cytochrome P450
VHRRRELWPNPEGFDPERFAAEPSAARHRFAYFPFGGGPRQCIGNQFALMEALIILAMVTQRHCLDLVPGHRVEPHALITLHPRHGVPMTLQPAA